MRPELRVQLRRILVTVVAGLIGMVCGVAGTNAQLPNRKPPPNPKPASDSLPGVLMITADAACSVTIDDRKPVQFREGETKAIRVALGQHNIRVVAEAVPSVVWDGAIELKAAGQEIVPIQIKARVAQAQWMAAHAPAREMEPWEVGDVMLEVEPALGPAVHPLLKRLEDGRVRLSQAQPLSAGPLPSIAPGGARAALIEQSSRAGANVEVAGVTMQSCTVTVVLSLWNRARPTTWSAEETGAAVGQTAACAAARRKAAGSAITSFLKAVRREKS